MCFINYKYFLRISAVILLGLILVVECRPIHREERDLYEIIQWGKEVLSKKFQDARNFLQDFGWLPKWNPETVKTVTKNMIKKAIRKFQRFFGLEETGEMDNATTTLMATPRCGVADNMAVYDAEFAEGPDGSEEGNITVSRRKRYVLQKSVILGQKWKRRDLKYRVTKYSSKIDKATIDGALRKAFFEWQKVGPFSITLKPEGGVNLDIKFENGDGPGKALAYAWGPGPGEGGDIRFDEYEDWTVRSASGQNLYMVALHEIGHTFGLDHSNVPGAIMNPYYSGYVQGKSLQPDDIAGLQAIYGPPNATSPTPVPPSPSKIQAKQAGTARREKLSSVYRDVCSSREGDKLIDGVTITADKRIYGFNGRYFFELKQDNSQLTPELISQGWPGLPETIDTVFTGPEGNTFFFKGDQYYRFRNRQMSAGYPKPISQGFPGVPGNLDAAFIYNPNKKIYFIKGNQYYRFESGEQRRVADGYPKSLSEWKGLPSKVDAAVQWRDGRTYFFAGKNYYKFNDFNFQVEEGYPKSTGSWWFACPETVGAENDVEAGTDIV